MATLRHSRNLRPIEESEVAPERLRVFGGVIVLFLVVLLARLWYLQILQGDRFREEARANSARPFRAVAPRGAIEDVRGRALVTNRAQFSVFVVPPDLPKDEEKRARVFLDLAGILEMTPEALQANLKTNKVSASDPIPVAEGVSMKILSRIAENRMRLPGVTAQAEPVRHYPLGKFFAAHLLGTIGPINPAEIARKENLDLGYRPGDFIGKSGVERQYDRLLNGKEGGTWYEVDARGRRQRQLRVQDPITGAGLRLCLDKDVQAAAEQAMGDQHGAAVAIDPRNGRVLAMVSRPTFDPNLFARRPLLAREYKALMDPRANHPLQNRAISSPQPPGSTFKIITATAGLATGALGPHSTDYCRGGIPMGGRIKRCHARHGGVTLETAIAASCDVFFYHAGRRIGPTPLAHWAEQFGLGRRTGIDLPSERGGTVPSPAWKAVMAPKFGNPDTRWYPGDTANMAIGQGDLQTTPLQIAQAAGAIGNGGVIYKPRVLEQAVSADQKVLYQMKPEVLQKVPISQENLRLVAQGMRSVVHGGRGTSRRARLAGITVAGKSGSAETRGGGPTHAWFMCYAPYEKPTIAICVFLETRGRGLHGGSDAAPIARTMMAAHFNVPDRAAD
uniref:Peptidoglycan D,D-transpeptidase MrdA n=1 Tax=uncultured Armatimonadetes bacterium TaxID=157466 RepID=A0A6J4K6C8_9BACT|nr:Peptidoglycan D,D-transpeptidase MrdA [uncultured Armatimonadetes bacterium]